MTWLEALRLAGKAERRGRIEDAQALYANAYESCPTEIEEILGAKIVAIDAMVSLRKQQSLGLFGKIGLAIKGRAA